MIRIARKTWSICLVCLILCLSAFSAAAGDQATPCKDEETGVSFIVPAGWTRQTISLNTIKDAINQFSFEHDSRTAAGKAQASFVYYSTDCYEKVRDDLPSWYTRSNVNNKIMTVEEFEEFFAGASNSAFYKDVKTVSERIGDYAYFKLTGRLDTILASGDLVLYAHINNGYLYFFMAWTSGGKESDSGVSIDSELRSIMQTVVFHEEKGINSVMTNAQKESSKKSAAIFVFFFPIVLIILVILIVRGVIRKARRKKAAALEETFNQQIRSMYGQSPDSAEPNGQASDAQETGTREPDAQETDIR